MVWSAAFRFGFARSEECESENEREYPVRLQKNHWLRLDHWAAAVVRFGSRTFDLESIFPDAKRDRWPIAASRDDWSKLWQ